MSGFKSLLIIIGVLISSVSLALAFGMTNAVLNGDYIVSEYNPYQGTPSAALSSVSFDGNGSASSQVLYDSVRDLESGTFTYSVSSDGRLTATIGSEIVGYGIVRSDGSVFTLAQTEDDAGIIVGIKKSSGMTNAVLNGDYIVSEYNPYQGTPSAALSSVSFDGNGSASSQVLYDSVRDLESGTFTYSVSSDGRLTATIGSEIVGYGIVRSDGSVFTLAQTEDDAGIIVGIKKSLVDKAMPWIPLLLLDE